MSAKDKAIGFLERNWVPIVVVGAGAYLLWKFFGKGKDTQESAAIQSAVVQLEKQGVQPSYSEPTYNSFANSLYKAMFEWGTDEAVIFNVFEQLQNDVDVLKTIDAFGERRPTLTESGALTKYDLAAYLYNDLDTDDIARINQMFANKGIRYRF